MVPPPQAYFEPINWHRTALHELGHASGHPSRLGRDLGGVFGSKKYAFEELVALFRRPTVRYGRTPEPETPISAPPRFGTTASARPGCRPRTGG